MSGFAHAGFQLTADRYSYLLGMAAAAVLTATVWIGGLAILTSRQVGLAKTPRACGVRRSG